ncbi:MAG: hypothetical protein PHW25_01000 [Zoogloea sp.]|uniref:hypothetical protein n=1 Tax=Zoogloea sp. TaxID=49181 RepID=UPI00261DBCE2|nr:hypothetical protein [Zoogloea sp.]MDD3325644.1 hypothetical protein [Zoogloea sp.]
MQKIRTALQECRAALERVQRIGSVEREPGEVTVNFEPACAQELTLIEDALHELTALEVGLMDLLRSPRCSACDEANRSRLAAMKPPATDEANLTGA